ncbi:MTA/SAH nucleosidase [Prevotella sp. 10(H)]|uniref:5'-methylthioadenosine/S-adenosylhomocysteine nucleosidase family protein n=1 Tax=Prevotella sp. 10(H) TaxID=1158294 RepID=UPI0004A715B7|nr:MTA/SAH nucleosidase [Prevotella sp. 10(H)]
MKTILTTYAVKDEYIDLKAEGFNIIPVFTGIGKTRSATILTRHICEIKPDFVINIGTAGTLIHNVGDIFISNHFIDRDYEVTKLPGVEYEIEGLQFVKGYETLKNWIINYNKAGICSTGDTFVTEVSSFKADVIDMEAYAQAFVCRSFNIPFLSIKYITDVVGQNSVQHWEDKLPDARAGLLAWVEQHRLLSMI